jgi:hypothetical protein
MGFCIMDDERINENNIKHKDKYMDLELSWEKDKEKMIQEIMENEPEMPRDYVPEIWRELERGNLKEMAKWLMAS